MSDERQNVLPSIPLPTNTIEIGDQKVVFRSLSRAEALKVATEYKDNIDGAEIYILACGVGVTVDEAAEWRTLVDPISAGKLIDAIVVLTGLSSDPNL